MKSGNLFLCVGIQASPKQGDSKIESKMSTVEQNDQEQLGQEDDISSDCDDMDVGDEVGHSTGINPLYAMQVTNEDAKPSATQLVLDRRPMGRSKSLSGSQ